MDESGLSTCDEYDPRARQDGPECFSFLQCNIVLDLFSLFWVFFTGRLRIGIHFLNQDVILLFKPSAWCQKKKKNPRQVNPRAISEYVRRACSEAVLVSKSTVSRLGSKNGCRLVLRAVMLATLKYDKNSPPPLFFFFTIAITK